MKLPALESHERRALVALVHHMIRVDGQLTDDEIGSMSDVAEELGEHAWRAAFRSVLGSHHKEEDVLELADAVHRPAARAAIREVLRRVAASDHVADAEAAFLERLDARWGGS